MWATAPNDPAAARERQAHYVRNHNPGGRAAEASAQRAGAGLSAATRQRLAVVTVAAPAWLYPGVYGADGFFDAVNPVTGALGHRYLVVDQSMIMASIDNAPSNCAIQRDFASDPVSWAARSYLSPEHMSI